MNWDQRYKEAGIKDWADRKRTKKVTEEWREYQRADERNEVKERVGEHERMAGTHFAIFNQNDDPAHEWAAQFHMHARQAYDALGSHLANPHPDRVQDSMMRIQLGGLATMLGDMANDQTRRLIHGEDYDE